MTDVMCDIETTGTDPGNGAIIQLSAIKFNYATGQLGGMFDRCPSPLPRRYWDDGTRAFWMGRNRAVYDGIVARAENPIPVFNDFDAWASDGAPNGGYRFWSKPLSFDWPFVASHFTQLGLTMPFFFRYARDLNSFMAGLRGDPTHPDMESQLENEGTAHDGLHDCAYQIDMLMLAKSRHIHAEIAS